MNLVIFEDAGWQRLLPLSWMRAVFELRCGRDTLLASIEAALHLRATDFIVREPLEAVVRMRTSLSAARESAPTCYWNGRARADVRIEPPPVGVAWVARGTLIAATAPPGAPRIDRLALFESEGDGTQPPDAPPSRLADTLRTYQIAAPPPEVHLIEYAWEPMLYNGQALKSQLRDGRLHVGRLTPGVHFLAPENICIRHGAVIKPGCVLDAEEGPIEIAEDVLIQPNAVIEGPCYIGRGTVIRPGATIRADTTIGEVCRVGGEIECSIFHAFANKQHDGFVGHSYICPWVNLGADTVTSDLKNTYGTIRVAPFGVEIESGRRLIGSLIGDHAKTGIGTMLTTGCVIGVAANVFTTGFTSKFIPSFSWLSAAGRERARLEKVIEIARTVMQRRGVELTALDLALLHDTAAVAQRIEHA